MGCACIIPNKSIKSKEIDLINNNLEFQDYKIGKNINNLNSTKISYNLPNIKSVYLCSKSNIKNNTIIKSTNIKSTNIKSSLINTSYINNSIINTKENIENLKNDEKEYILSGPIINYVKRTVKNHSKNKLKKIQL